LTTFNSRADEQDKFAKILQKIFGTPAPIDFIKEKVNRFQLQMRLKKEMEQWVADLERFE
jgi:hypothetical protein